MISHAEAIEQIGDAATERHGIEHVLGDPSTDPELRAHVAGCPDCQREIHAWQQTATALLMASPLAGAEGADLLDDAGEPAEPIPALAPDVRGRVLAAVLMQGVPRGTGKDRGTAVGPGLAATATGVAAPAAGLVPPATGVAARAGGQHAPVAIGDYRQPRSGRRPVRFRWLALAAAAVLVVFVCGALLGGPLGLVRTNNTADQLRLALAASGRIIESADHRQAALLTADGDAVGAVLVDGQSGDLVVLSNGGDEDTGTEVYHCYLVRGDGPRTWLGEMVAQAGTTFWAGHVDDVADLGRAGDVILIVDGGTAPEFTATF